MKNVLNLVLALGVLVATNATARVAPVSTPRSAQPVVPTSEETPVQIMGGVNTNLNKGAKYGLGHIGGNLRFSHNVGWDIEYFVGATVAYSNSGGRLFAQETTDFKTSDYNGVGVDVDVGVRFMPEVAENFRFGLGTVIGYGDTFSSSSQEFRQDVYFGDLYMKVGPRFSYNWDAATFYMSPSYVLSSIRFLKDTASQEIKNMSNWSGFEAETGLWLAVTDSLGTYGSVTWKAHQFQDIANNWSMNFNLGVSFAL